MKLHSATKEKAKQWYDKHPWLVGCNYIPSTAINQLEMWQEDTFDPETIDKELSWANKLRFNLVRVYLHDLLWQQDSNGFMQRIDRFLTIADKHNIKVMFVLFDSCWDPCPKLGKQHEPWPHVHNSGWVQSPHIDILKKPWMYVYLKSYVKGIFEKYGNDDRVLVWDIYNEPDNTNGKEPYEKYEASNKDELALQLLKLTFKWARQVNPSQSLTVCLWKGDWSSYETMSELDKFAIDNSDIITFHDYCSIDVTTKRVKQLMKYDKPLICTEYMARNNGSTFKDILPLFKKHKIGAVNWGFVAGKTQTQYPWDSWKKKYTSEPKLWFHDVFRIDGTAYNKDEVEFIKTITSLPASVPALLSGCTKNQGSIPTNYTPVKK